MFGCCAFGVHSARAIILFGTADPTVNTTAPTGSIAGSGWQYQGTWGSFLGTPIAPNYFLSAGHIGQAGSTFIYQGVSYAIVTSFGDPMGDLLIWQVSPAFPTYAALYPREDEAGQALVVFGRGSQRGSEIDLDGTARGWAWGTSDSVERWGQNTVASIVTLAGGDDFLYATFNQGVGATEATLSDGDSGGAVFLEDGTTWKLAGINYGVDEVFSDNHGDGALTAALYDARGYYDQDDDGSYELITGASPVPLGFYATRVSSRLSWINSVIDPCGDSTGSGVPNLLKYAFALSPTVPSVTGLPVISRAGGVVTLTYTMPVANVDVTYTVEQSNDLVTWTTATVSSSVVLTGAKSQTVQDTVTTSGTPAPFYHVRITRP